MMKNEKRAAGIIFANMHDDAISSLTQERTMASVPFGGRYRLIDFPLSNLVNANIIDVGVITKANYASLMDHVGNGREWDLARKRGGLHILPPYGNKNYGIYRGKMEALGAALFYLQGTPVKQVVLSDCELIANIDLMPLMEQHRETGADITIMYSKAYMSQESARDVTVVHFDEEGRLDEVMCNPDMSGEFSYFMNIAVMDREFLIKLVRECISKGEYSLDRDVLQKRMKQLNIRGVYYDGFVQRVNSIQEYYWANLDLLKEDIREELFCKDRPIYTKVRDEAPVLYGANSNMHDCFVADGCMVEGAVENSILFRGCKIGKDAVVKNCVLMQDTIVEDGAILQNVITDKKVHITKERTVIGAENCPSYIAKKTKI